MYICICRAITDGQIKARLDDTPELSKDWAEVSRCISGEPVNCGACIQSGQLVIDHHIKKKGLTPHAS